MSLKTLLQTHTRVHSPREEKRQREESLLASRRMLASHMMLCQLLLWVVFYGYDQAAQAVWQSMLVMLPGLWLLLRVWKRAGDEPRAALPLLLCLLGDLALNLTAYSGFVSQLVPHYPAWVCAAAPAGLVWLTALWAGERGVSYGAWALRGLCAVLFVFATVLLRASNRADRLFPILGRGMPVTALAGLNGLGGLWGAALFYAPFGRRAPRAGGYALYAFLLGGVWALWHGFVRPWSAGESLAVAEKMMGLARHATSITLYEMAGLLWMVLLPLCMAGALAAGSRLVQRAFPACPRWAVMTGLLALPLAGALWQPAQMLGALAGVLPWRYAISLGCGLWAGRSKR